MKIKMKYMDYTIKCDSLRLLFHVLFTKNGKETMKYLIRNFKNVESFSFSRRPQNAAE